MGEAVVTSSSGRGGMEEEEEEEMENNNSEKEETEKKEGSSAVVRWEKFLPRMVLRVLLVEADDSTRHIISALLRKCSYQVVAVPDGLMAWETLKGRPRNIDLILTEVELPSISGYALLTLVMEHDVCKNIPVIMMSSHDSISTVLKCMLKGAADFLIKPVRRNELRNLWQHVWRRQTVTAGHIPPNSSNAQHKVEAASDNNSASDLSSDCATSSHKRKEYSDKGNDAPGSKLNGRSSSNLRNMEKEKYEESLDKRSDIPESKNGGWSTRLQLMDVSHNEVYGPAVLKLGGEHAFSEITIQEERGKLENHRRNADTPQDNNDEHIGSSGGAIDLIGTFDNGPKHAYGSVSINDSTNKFEFPSQLELSLKRFFPNSSKNLVTEERHALNHSNASAFSWYNSKILQPLFPSPTSDCKESKEDASKSPELSSNQIFQNVHSVSQRHSSNLNGSQEMLTTLVNGQSGKTELAYTSPQKLITVSGMRPDNICNRQGHAFSPLFFSQPGLSSWSPKLASQKEQSPFPTSTSVHSNPDIQDSERINRQSVETITNSGEQIMHQQNHMEHVEELKHDSPSAGQSTGSSMCNSVADHYNSNAYGSFSSRNGNATSVAPSEKPAGPGSSKDGGIFVCDQFKGMDSGRSSQREAALTKFRLKRKDRCYEKKVRYQSRKRLAEMRPRVKGQFVRQVPNDASSGYE